MNKKFFIKQAGGVQKLADLLRVTRQTVHRWPTKLPSERVYQLKGMHPEWFVKAAK